MKKWWVAVGLLLAVVLSACSSDSNSNGSGSDNRSDDDGEVNLTVWTWPNNDQTFENITIPLFEEEHPNIKVTVQAFGQDQYADKLSSSLIGGNVPDVAMVEINNVENVKNLELFEDLSQEPYNAGEFSSKYLDYFWDYVTNEDGYIFALPKNSAPAAMFYNKPIFEAAGLPTDPEAVHELLSTWEDYLAVAEDLSINGEQWMLGVPSEIANAVTQQAGTAYFNEQGDLQIDNEEFMYVYDLVDQLGDIGAFSPYEQYSPEWNAAIQQGNIATFLFGNWFGKYLKNNTDGAEGEWGVTYAPGYQGNSSYNQGGDFIDIPKDGSNKEAAWEFVKFVTQNEDNFQAMYEQDELYPAYLEMLDKEWMNNENPFFGNQVTNEIFQTVAEDMTAPYVTENDPVAGEGVKNLLANITLGNMEIEQALEQAKQEIEAKIQ
ncbi:ABC transporter substrate-binding protein [Gracilibacillus alcaliphilus]|uniref:ABC transporter substrate-binding protein n=1 Tax=Gracilibacillus alcaliphilus TaxID=1401441 RepID=UPI00195C2C8B|nr:extracellular solute-binding protein [Gracilibacillus alcaliphilus]MBM7676188.1 ABC-type glycerol-3-phosphate transport system substrate-binding protein [Gracilibacillus alcaliphilus]